MCVCLAVWSSQLINVHITFLYILVPITLEPGMLITKYSICVKYIITHTVCKSLGDVIM